MDADTNPPPRLLSAEYTPIEYDYYIRKAHQLRADALHDAFWGAVARLGRLFRRAPAAPRREPVLVKHIQSRTA
jgi:hypothetical protein